MFQIVYISWLLSVGVRTMQISIFSVMHAHLGWVFGTLLDALALCSPSISWQPHLASSTMKLSPLCQPSTGLFTIFPFDPAHDWLYTPITPIQSICSTASEPNLFTILFSSLLLSCCSNQKSIYRFFTSQEMTILWQTRFCTLAMIPSFTMLWLYKSTISDPLDWHWGQMSYNTIPYQLQTTSTSYLEPWVSQACSSTCSQECNWCLICCSLQLSSQLLHLILQTTWLPNWPNTWHPQFLHCLHGTPH